MRSNFSAGANLMLVLRRGAGRATGTRSIRWCACSRSATLALRYATVPVVVAPAGLALGGGCEFALHADRVQAAAETYMGLVEVGVGLIPAGGGTKEMMAARGRTRRLPARGSDAVRANRRSRRWRSRRVSTSGPRRACDSATSSSTDAISMNRERLIADAKALALAARAPTVIIDRCHVQPIAVGGDDRARAPP
ncbi:MAG: enoyl-CoA hydratase/isomerase family protein [Vicinamibacterales bacterium]